MKAEGLVLLIIGTFFGLVAIAYWIWSGETSGTAMLIGACLLGLFPGGYYFWWSRRMKARPEDDPHAAREEGSGVVGAFPSSSVWPFVFGMGAALVALGLVFGFWSAIVGVVVILAAAIGVVRESRRGGVV